MCDCAQDRGPRITSRRLRLLVVCVIGALSAVSDNMRAAVAERYDPFEARPRFHDPFEAESNAGVEPKTRGGFLSRRPAPVKDRERGYETSSSNMREVRDPFDGVPDVAPKAARAKTAYQPHQTGARPKQANYQFPTADQAGPSDALNTSSPDSTSSPADQSPQVNRSSVANDPCVAAAEKPLGELGIGIEPPAGQLPTNRAAACWDSINSRFGPLAGTRTWTGFDYYWDATCLCHRPLYFEEINLERYGYGCGWCLQPAASAAHFFGTVPALPYLAAVDCPHECIYTLGHYRPGSCPPWRHHWPPCDPLAVAAEGGVLTGLIFLIP
jgi:hypothetical protein